MNGWFGRLGRSSSAAYIAVRALGCSGHVDLGEAGVAVSPKPTTNEIEQAAQTESVAAIRADRIEAIAMDESYLYLNNLPDPSDYYVKSLLRCSKLDCWRTMKTLRRLGDAYGSLSLFAGELGWNNTQGLYVCSAPECADARLEPGVVIAGGQGSVPAIWTRDRFFWYLPIDGAIYACDRPGCADGPRRLASTTGAEDLSLFDEQLYWIDRAAGLILRTKVDGSGARERLTLEQQTAWTTSMPEPGMSAMRNASIDGPWIYVTLESYPTKPSLAPCNDCTSGYDLARWRRADDGAEREWLLVDDATFDATGFLARVIDGEVFWVASGGGLWSCLADNCAATKRQLGVEAQVGQAGVVADEQFVYWLSAPCDFNNDCGPEWNLKRTPRIPR